MKKYKGTYERDTGGRELYFPLSQQGEGFGDCVFRACSIATGLDYKLVWDTLLILVKKWATYPTTKKVYEKFLLDHGFTKNKPPKDNRGKKISIRNWSAEAPKGRIVASTREHLIAIVDNVQRDAWLDERCVNSWYHKEAQQ